MKASIRKAVTPSRRSAPRVNERRLVTQHPRRRILSLVAGAAALPAISKTAGAQTYPTRPVRIVVGYAAGGSQSIISRLMGQWLSGRLGQSFIIENRPGASSNVAVEAVVRAPADGYTLLMVSITNAMNATLYDKFNFNLIRDIAPVAGIVRVPLVMEVNPSVLAKTVPEFITYAKANPGKLNFASAGNGTSQHVSAELFKAMSGVSMLHVPYRGAAPALTDLLAGQVQVMFDVTASSLPYIRAGKLRPLAATTATRLELMPDIPTMGEFLPGYEASAWAGFGVPKGTPAAIINMLNREVNAALADPMIKARLGDLGATVLPGSPADFGKLIAEETEKWGKVIRAANIKPE